MAKRRYLIEFRLTMPGTGQAKSVSFGHGRNYLVFRSLGYEDMFRLFGPGVGREKRYWFHRWTDGWTACVEGRVMEPDEKRAKSDGFAGYEWMVDNIIRYGQTEKPVETAVPA